MSPVLSLSYGLSMSYGLRERRKEIHTRDFKNKLRRGQRERQKTIGFNKQNSNFARASRFFCIFLCPFLHEYDVKMPNFAFYGVRKQASTKFYFNF